MKKQLSNRDWEALSAYLDGQLSRREQEQLKTRLQQNPQLRATIQELRQARQVVRSLPRLRAPRNFTLSPQDIKQIRTIPRLVPAFSLVSAVASLLLIIVVLTSIFSPGWGTASVAIQADEAPAMEMVPVEKAPEPEMMSEDEMAEEPAMMIIEEGAEEPEAQLSMPVEAPAAEEALPEAEILDEEPTEELLAANLAENNTETPQAEEQMSGAASAEFYEPTAYPSEATDQTPIAKEGSEPTPSPDNASERGIPTETPVETPLEEEIPQPEMLAAPPMDEASQPEDTGNGIPQPSAEQEPPVEPIPWLTWIEAGLAMVALLSGVVTLILYRRWR